MRFCTLFFILFSLSSIAQKVHHVYPADLRYYKERITKIRLKDTTIIYRGYDLKRNLNGLYYFYNSVDSKMHSSAQLYVNGKAYTKKKFIGKKQRVPYYEERVYYNPTNSTIIKEIRDSSYWYNRNLPTYEYWYDSSSNLLSKSHRKLFKSNDKWIDSWIWESYNKNGNTVWRMSYYDTLNKDCYDGNGNCKIFRKIEHFDGITGCILKELCYSRNQWDSDIEDLPYRYYISYWDTTHKSFSNCKLQPDTLIKKITLNSSYSTQEIEYRSDTLYKIRVYDNIKIDSSSEFGNQQEYYSNGVLKYVSDKGIAYPGIADTVNRMYDSLGNMLYTRLVKLGKRTNSEQLYKSTGLKHFLYMTAWYNKRKRVERYYTPDGVLFRKKVYRNGKLKRERNF